MTYSFACAVLYGGWVSSFSSGNRQRHCDLAPLLNIDNVFGKLVISKYIPASNFEMTASAAVIIHFALFLIHNHPSILYYVQYIQ